MASFHICKLPDLGEALTVTKVALCCNPWVWRTSFSPRAASCWNRVVCTAKFNSRLKRFTSPVQPNICFFKQIPWSREGFGWVYLGLAFSYLIELEDRLRLDP